MTRTEMEMEKAMKNYYETEFNETAAEMPEYPDKDAMDAEMAAIAEAEAAEMEAAEQEYEALVFAKFCETQDKIEDDLRREMERTAGRYFDHAVASGA